MNSTSPAVKKRRHRSIVVVGNNTDALLSLSLLLQRFEYDVSLAYTAAQALEQIAEHHPALVLTDLTLPGMSGMDLFHLLRQDVRTEAIPVLFMIPLSDAAAERRCLDTGAAGCIGKPVQAEELYRTVEAIIEPRPRENIRIDTRLAVSVNNKPLDCPQGTCEIDLSESGIYVPTDKPFPRNRRVAVTINIKDRTISVVGTVIHSHASGERPAREPGMGLKFVDIEPQDQEFIRRFIRDEATRDIKTAAPQGPTDPWK